MGTPGKKPFSGAGKAPERIVFYREGGSFKPQSQAARSWDERAEVHLEKNRSPGGVADSGAASYNRSGVRTQHQVVGRDQPRPWTGFAGTAVSHGTARRAVFGNAGPSMDRAPIE